MKKIPFPSLPSFYPRYLKRIVVFSLSWFFTTTALANAYKVENLEFKDTFNRGSVELSLRGAGLKKFLSIRVAAAALYLKQDADAKDILKDIPKSLEVIYLQNIPDVELQNATTKGIRLNVSEKEFKVLSSNIDLLNTYYPSVRKMDRIRVTYIPGKGTIVEVNGAVKGTVPGADFGRAFFSIWVGNRPVDARIKQIIMGKFKKNSE